MVGECSKACCGGAGVVSALERGVVCRSSDRVGVECREATVERIVRAVVRVFEETGGIGGCCAGCFSRGGLPSDVTQDKGGWQDNGGIRDFDRSGVEACGGVDARVEVGRPQVATDVVSGEQGAKATRVGCVVADYGLRDREGGCCGDEGLDAHRNRVIVAGGAPRGPNYLRNQESRMRKRIAKEEKKRAALQGNWRREERDDPDAELAQQVRRMRLERQKIQEQRKLDKLRSPTQMIEDAMRQVALAEKYAKLANDSKVAEWAANLSSASAESIAKSAGSSFTGSRVETVNTEYTSPGVKKDRFSVSYFPLTSAERVVVENRAIRVDKIEDIRRQYGRPLNYGDFMKSNFPHKLDASVRQLVKFAEEEELNNLVGY